MGTFQEKLDESNADGENTEPRNTEPRLVRLGSKANGLGTAVGCLECRGGLHADGHCDGDGSDQKEGSS